MKYQFYKINGKQIF